MRIGILTFQRAYNCGAALQAWSLRTVLERMGHTVEFPTCNSVGDERRWNCLPSGIYWMTHFLRALRAMLSFVYHFPAHLLSIPCVDIMHARYQTFRKRFLPERDCTPQDFSKYFDIIVAGSDQIWTERIVGTEAPLFFGEWEANGIPLISYAASCGDGEVPETTMNRLRKDLTRFSHISVREAALQKRLEDLTGRSIAHVLDPTLLMSAQDYDEIAEGEVPQEPYLFMYILMREEPYVKAARELAKRLGVRCVIASCYVCTRWKKLPEQVLSISPDRLVQYVRHAKYVLTSSFHGTALSVVFRKPFLSFSFQKRNMTLSRIGSLLHLIGCEERLMCPDRDINEMREILSLPLPDYSSALEHERAKSLAWLESTLVANEIAL